MKDDFNGCQLVIDDFKLIFQTLIPTEATPSGYLQSCNVHCHCLSPPFSTLSTADDDVDLEQLVNEMNSSMESVYSTTDTALLLNNGHAHAPHQHHIHAAYPGHSQAHRRHTPPLPSSSPSRERLQHSQPMHIQAVRCLQEAQQLRPASLPAIPNPFPELCSPAGSPILSPIQTSDNHEVSSASRMLCRVQTSVAESGIWLGTFASRASLNLLNPSASRPARQAPISGSHASTLGLGVTVCVSVRVCA
ncbi:hypothetical protein PAMP_007800 [Pampus punctatissimus]